MQSVIFSPVDDHTAIPNIVISHYPIIHISFIVSCFNVQSLSHFWEYMTSCNTGLKVERLLPYTPLTRQRKVKQEDIYYQIPKQTTHVRVRRRAPSRYNVKWAQQPSRQGALSAGIQRTPSLHTSFFVPPKSSALGHSYCGHNQNLFSTLGV